LRAAGAVIEGIGTETLTVRGVSRLTGTQHWVNSDRIEAGTFLCAAAATRGEILVEDITWEELGETADAIAATGVTLKPQGGGLLASCVGRPRAVDVRTDPFPSFSTDLQPPMAAVLATAEGESHIYETVYNDRLQYASELQKMGAEIELTDTRHAIIHGVPRLTGAVVSGHNIRDGAALVIAALAAEGESVVGGQRYVARGYEKLEAKLRGLGAEIEAC
jgi:UDP-N-acetylglucosamine 1-carboxyvinyltransferase